MARGSAIILSALPLVSLGMLRLVPILYYYTSSIKNFIVNYQFLVLYHTILSDFIDFNNIKEPFITSFNWFAKIYKLRIIYTIKVNIEKDIKRILEK